MSTYRAEDQLNSCEKRLKIATDEAERLWNLLEKINTLALNDSESKQFVRHMNVISAQRHGTALFIVRGKLVWG